MHVNARSTCEDTHKYSNHPSCLLHAYIQELRKVNPPVSFMHIYKSSERSTLLSHVQIRNTSLTVTVHAFQAKCEGLAVSTPESILKLCVMCLEKGRSHCDSSKITWINTCVKHANICCIILCANLSFPTQSQLKNSQWRTYLLCKLLIDTAITFTKNEQASNAGPIDYVSKPLLC